MKKSIFALALVFSFFGAIANTQNTAHSLNDINTGREVFKVKAGTVDIVEWNYTTGYHSDGTSASIRYLTDWNGNISSIQIKSSGSWGNTYVKYDKGRRYVNNSWNKRYYF